MNRVKVSPLFVALALTTLALSSWGLFHLLHDFGDVPPGLAVLAVGGLDVVAVLFGKHALTVAADGDSSAPWNAGLLVYTGLAAFAQFAYAGLAGHPLVLAVVFAAFPCATVLLFEGQLRRAYRLNGRASGRLAPPRATFDLIVWVLYPRQAMRATRFAVLDRGLDSDTALTLAELDIKRQAAEAERRPARRRIQRSYAHLLEGGELVEADTPADTPDVRTITSGQPGGRGALTAAVRTAHARHGDNLPAVLADVRTTLPDAADESVRRLLGRMVSGQAS